MGFFSSSKIMNKQGDRTIRAVVSKYGMKLLEADSESGTYRVQFRDYFHWIYLRENGSMQIKSPIDTIDSESRLTMDKYFDILSDLAYSYSLIDGRVYFSLVLREPVSEEVLYKVIESCDLAVFAFLDKY